MNRAEKFEYKMGVASKVMREDRRVLAALAEFDKTGKHPDWFEAGLKQKEPKD